MAFDFDTLKKRVGKNIKYYSTSGDWLTDRELTEEDIGEYINEVYTEELFPLYASRWPHMFRHIGLLNSWIMTTTVVASSTGSNLVIDISSGSVAFTNAMEGLTIYNSTDDETRTLKTFVDSDEFTLDSDIDDDWDGDTVWVLGQEFAFGGDGEDLISVERVKVKFDASQDFRICELREKQDLYATGQETFSKTYPYAYITSIQDSGSMYNAIGILPGFDEKISNAIEIEYIAKPEEMSNDTDKPIIPIVESIICGATMKAYEKKQDTNMASYWAMKYELSKKRDLSRYRPNTSNVPTKMKVNRLANYIHRRLI